MIPRLQAVVMGPCVAYGNKRSFPNRRTGGLVVVERNAVNIRDWQDTMRKAMWEARARAELPLLDGIAVAMTVTVSFRRPRGHFKRDGSLSREGERSHVPTKRPDFDKIARAVADCGTGIWYRDDAQVADGRVLKIWGDVEATAVSIEEMP